MVPGSSCRNDAVLCPLCLLEERITDECQPASAGSSLHPALAGVEDGCSLTLSALQRGLPSCFSRSGIRIPMAATRYQNLLHEHDKPSRFKCRRLALDPLPQSSAPFLQQQPPSLLITGRRARSSQAARPTQERVRRSPPTGTTREEPGT